MVGHGVTQQYYDAIPFHTKNGFRLIQTAHNDSYKLLRNVVRSTTNIQERLRHIIMNDIRGIIKRTRKNIKFIITVSFVSEKSLRPGVFTIPPAYFKSSPVRTTSGLKLEEMLGEIYNDLWLQIENYVKIGSVWALRELKEIDLQVCFSYVYSYIIYLLNIYIISFTICWFECEIAFDNVYLLIL